MTRRHLAAVAFLCGGVLGWFVGGRFDPTHAEIRAAAEDLVPDGASVTERRENTGHPIIVGAYFAVVDFEVPGGTDVESVLYRRAHALGYRYPPDPVVNVGPGITHRMVHKPMRARLTAFTTPAPGGTARGRVRVEADPDSQQDRRMVGAVGGSIGLPALTLLLIGWWKRARNSGRRSGEPPGG